MKPITEQEIDAAWTKENFDIEGVLSFEPKALDICDTLADYVSSEHLIAIGYRIAQARFEKLNDQIR